MKAGWKARQLGEIALLQSGFAFKSKEYTPTGHRLIRIANVQDGHLSDEKPKFVMLDGKTAKFQLEEGDLLTSLTGNVGRVARMSAELLPAALNQRVLRIKATASESVDAKYLELVLKSRLFRGYLEDRSHGAAQANVSPKVVAAFPIPLPPLEEQQHIVAILDEAFEGLDRAKANAEANLASARELFQAALGEAFNPPDDVKDGWAQSTVGEAFETVTGTTPKKSEKALYGDHLGLVKPPELADADVNSARCSDFLSEDGVKAARVAPKGAVLVGCIGNLGKLGITSEPVAFNQQINAIFPKPEAATPKFVFYYCMTPMFLDALNARASGTTVSIVNKSKFNSIPIPLPPLEGQKRIVERLDKLRERTSLLAASYANAKENADKLRQSLLAKAFAGELT